jgi:hypothetical protein
MLTEREITKRFAFNANKGKVAVSVDEILKDLKIS